MNPEEFAKHVLTGVRPASEPFKPTATYNPDGDCIEFLASPESHYGERVDHLLTVFYGHRSGRIVGLLIKGVKTYLQEHPASVISVRDGKIRLDHFLVAQFSTSEQKIDKVTVMQYRKVIEAAEGARVEVEIDEDLLCGIA